MGWSYLSWRTQKSTMWQRRNTVEETLNSLASCVMILTQPNSPFSCTPRSHLAPCYCSLHLPSPPHSPTMETPHQEMCGSSPSPISWVTPLPSSNTLTCLIMLIKRKLLLPRDRGTRGKSEMSTPAPWQVAAPGLSPQQPTWWGDAPALSQGHTQLGHGRWLAAGLGGEGRCCRCADWQLVFLQQRLWRPPQSGSEAPTASTLSRWFSSNFRNFFSLFCPHTIITYLLYTDCQIWGL